MGTASSGSSNNVISLAKNLGWGVFRNSSQQPVARKGSIPPAVPNLNYTNSQNSSRKNRDIHDEVGSAGSQIPQIATYHDHHSRDECCDDRNDGVAGARGKRAEPHSGRDDRRTDNRAASVTRGIERTNSDSPGPKSRFGGPPGLETGEKHERTRNSDSDRVLESQEKTLEYIAKPPPQPKKTANRSTSTPDDSYITEVQEKLAKQTEALDICRENYERLKGRYRSLKETLQDTNDRLRRELENEKSLSAGRLQSYQFELDVQKGKFEELSSSHIKSVNSVGTGLDPISDQEFVKKLRALQDQVGQWSRAAFKKRGQLSNHSALIPQMLAPRVQIPNLRFPQYVEMVVWVYIEDNIFSTWFPGLADALQEHLEALHSGISHADKTPNLERSEFWRAYTASMIYQNTGVRESLDAGSKFEGQAEYLLSLLHQLQDEPVKLETQFSDTLHEILSSARILTAELKCQRSVYEVDHNIRVLDPYDDTTMADVRFSLDLEEDGPKKQAYVTGIIAKAVVKRPYRGSTAVDAYLAKAKVMIAVSEEVMQV